MMMDEHNKKMNRADTQIAVRLDDVCPQMDMERFENTVALIESFGVKGLLGIVPDNRDPDLMKMPPDPRFWQRIKQLEQAGWSLGMHGVQHRLTREGTALLSRSKKTEFSSVPLDEQRKLIGRGREILENNGVKTDIFFAPAHSYDRNTLRALKAEGFQYVSDGRSRHAYRQCGMICVPCRVYGLPGHPKGEVTIALHSNFMDAERLGKYERFLEKYKDSLVDFSQLQNSAPRNLMMQKLNERIYIHYFYARNKASTMKRRSYGHSK
jgi:predicted deacetylase